MKPKTDRKSKDVVEMKYNVSVKKRIEDHRENAKDRGDFTSYGRRGNFVRNKQESLFSPIKPSRVQSGKKEKW